MYKEMRKRLESDFEAAVAKWLPNFSRPYRVKVDGLLTTESSSANRFGEVFLTLSFSLPERFFLTLLAAPHGYVPGKASNIRWNQRRSSDLRMGWFLNVNAVDHVYERLGGDEFFYPVRPSPEEFLSRMYECRHVERVRRIFSYMVSDDALWSQFVDGNRSEQMLCDVKNYLQYVKDPWAEIGKWQKLSKEDIDFAVGGKMNALIEILAKETIPEFVELNERAAIA